MDAKITCMLPGRNDGTSWYRGMMPLAQLSKERRKMGDRIELCCPEKVSWADLVDSDILFAQRPFKQAHLDAVLLAKDCGLKVWVDYDDLVTSLPVSNSCYDRYRDCRPVVQRILALADYLTVSTAELGKELSQIMPPNKQLNYAEIPNAWAQNLFPIAEHMEERPPGPPRVLWRGTDTHIADLYGVSASIREFAKANPDVEWTFFGFRPHYLLGLPNSEFLPITDVTDYLRLLSRARYDACIVPLEDNGFNRAKSNIAWMEAAMTGAVTVAPKFSEWLRPGIINYGTGKSFAESLHWATVIQTEMGHPDVALAGRQHILEHMTLSRVNQLRYETIKELL